MKRFLHILFLLFIFSCEDKQSNNFEFYDTWINFKLLSTETTSQDGQKKITTYKWNGNREETIVDGEVIEVADFNEYGFEIESIYIPTNVKYYAEYDVWKVLNKTYHAPGDTLVISYNWDGLNRSSEYVRNNGVRLKSNSIFNEYGERLYSLHTQSSGYTYSTKREYKDDGRRLEKVFMINDNRKSECREVVHSKYEWVGNKVTILSGLIGCEDDYRSKRIVTYDENFLIQKIEIYRINPDSNEFQKQSTSIFTWDMMNPFKQIYP